MRSHENPTPTEAEAQLSAAAYALPGWRWLPGMALQDGRHRWRVCELVEAGAVALLVADPEIGAGDPDAVTLLRPRRLAGCVLDLADPATGGCLLSLLPPLAVTSIEPSSLGGLWRITLEVSSPWDTVEHRGLGTTLAGACVCVAQLVGRWGRP